MTISFEMVIKEFYSSHLSHVNFIISTPFTIKTILWLINCCVFGCNCYRYLDCYHKILVNIFLVRSTALKLIRITIESGHAMFNCAGLWHCTCQTLLTFIITWWASHKFYVVKQWGREESDQSRRENDQFFFVELWKITFACVSTIFLRLNWMASSEYNKNWTNNIHSNLIKSTLWNKWFFLVEKWWWALNGCCWCSLFLP